MKTFCPPNNGFILIVDSDGDVIDVFSRNCIIDDVFSAIERLNRFFPDDAPHSPWTWAKNGEFKLLEKI